MRSRECEGVSTVPSMVYGGCLATLRIVIRTYLSVSIVVVVGMGMGKGKDYTQMAIRQTNLDPVR